MAIVKITGENFEQEVVQSDKPVLVDFWAEWCGPCKMLSPVIEELAGEVDDVKIGKVNVDEEGELAQKFRVTGIPSLIILKNGEVAGKEVGVKNKDQVLEFIKNSI